MDTGNIGKWLWIIGLALALIGGLAGALGMALPGILGTVAQAAAFLGGLLHLSSMKDRTGFYIAALALGAFWAGAGTLFVDILGGIVSGLLGGGASAAAAGAAGMLLKTVYEWVMP